MIEVTNIGNAVEVYGRSGRWYTFEVDATVSMLADDADGLIDHPDFLVDILLEDEDSTTGAEEGEEE